MIAEQMSFSGREQVLSQKKGLLPHADEKCDAVFSDAFRFRWFMAVSGLAALVWVGSVGAVLLRPAATPPQKVADLAPQFLATAPAAANTLDSRGQMMEFGWLSGFEPTYSSDASRDARDEAAPPPVSAATPAPGNVPLPPARMEKARYDIAAAAAASKSVTTVIPAPARPISVTIRIFHPPLISVWYKDIVADKMKEEGISPKLEAKVRSGRQLNKRDLASIPKPVMEKINKQVIAYGQPPLYTDSTTTTLASAAR